MIKRAAGYLKAILQRRMPSLYEGQGRETAARLRHPGQRSLQPFKKCYDLTEHAKKTRVRNVGHVLSLLVLTD